MFSTALSFVGDVSLWQTGNVEDMTAVFVDCPLFSSDVSLWDVGKVKSFSNIFRGATQFNSPLPWNTSSATDLSLAFSGASSFDQSLESWETGQVSTFLLSFDSTSSFKGKGVGQFNLSSCNDIRFAFYNATSFDEDLSGLSTGKISDFSGLFAYASSFKGAGIEHWNMSNAFSLSG